MVLIPEKKNTTLSKIEEIKVVSEQRSYLSMSDIGNDCFRAMWMNFRWCSEDILSAKTIRIFARGDLEESRVVSYLKAAGVYVYKQWEEDGEKLPLTGAVGEEQEELIGFAGHAKGHPDGRCIGVIEAPKTPHLLEIKTMNDKYFKILLKCKLQTANPTYYDQMQRYMGEMKLTRGLFVAVNKNDEEIYIERVYFNKERYKALCEKERAVILSEFIPTKEFKPTWYKCRWCKHRFACHREFYDKFGEGKDPQANCRTCKHVDLGDDGKWFCSKMDDKELTVKSQRIGCSMYKLGIYPEE